MRRLILLLISSCAVLLVTAQEDFFSDSIAVKQPEVKLKQPVMERRLSFNEPTFTNEFTLPDISIFHQPLLPDYNKNLDFKKYLFQSDNTGFSYYTFDSPFNMAFPFGQVFNQSTFKLNDHLLIGGNSFGTRSVFDQPKLNPSIQEMSIKGASMFIQYKVNDRFKVQTRVSISNHPSSPWQP